tara:strand:- start:4975 stop:5367 length:393 start_codon:yes stop_codon:yes gene_type:complete
MGFLNKIFSGAASELVGGIGGIIDNLSTSKEEKLEAERKIKELILNHESKVQEEVSKRWDSDMKSDSWLSKNVRPMTLIFLVFSTVLMVFIDAGAISFIVDEDWKELLKIVLITCIGAYFGGRSYEKVKR